MRSAPARAALHPLPTHLLQHTEKRDLKQYARTLLRLVVGAAALLAFLALWAALASTAATGRERGARRASRSYKSGFGLAVILAAHCVTRSEGV